MKAAGIDIGSRFIKYVVIEDHQLIKQIRVDTGYEPKQTCEKLLSETKPDYFTVTGYGRQLFSEDNIPIITEIKAVAIGVHHFIPACRTIIDIGGQDTKAISLTANGRVSSFEMNDRCAAGTGRFLEVMAKNLGFSLEELGNLTKCEDIITINSLCTVFAESEVISLIARGIKRENIGLAVQNLIASRVGALSKQLQIKDTVVFTGGCAFNSYLKTQLEHQIGHMITVVPESPFLAAYGAAIHTEQTNQS